MEVVWKADQQKLGRSDCVGFTVPDGVKYSLHALLLNGGPYEVSVRKWRPKRTTGPKSQNHAINGYARQIANELGHTSDEVKHWAKMRATDKGYPFTEIEHEGKLTVIPHSERDIDTQQAGILIEELQMIAAEMDVILADINE